jgi:hypothetical protein
MVCWNLPPPGAARIVWETRRLIAQFAQQAGTGVWSYPPPSSSAAPQSAGGRANAVTQLARFEPTASTGHVEMVFVFER